MSQELDPWSMERSKEQQDLMAAKTNDSGSGQHDPSLAAARTPLGEHPQAWEGYERAALDLLALKRLDEALSQVDQGLQRLSENTQLLKLKDYLSAFVPSTNSQTRTLASKREHYELTSRDIIAYSGDPEFFHTIQSRRKHKPTPDNPLKQLTKKALFIAGLGRSGTTALGKALSISQAVEMYTELYPGLRLEGYQPSDFKRTPIVNRISRSKNKHDNETILNERHASSAFVGDKRPTFQFCIESTHDNFSPNQCTTIYIARDLASICKSAHARASNPSDHRWPAERGIEHTILQYNASCRQIIHLHNNRNKIFKSIIFVWYADFFQSKQAAHGLLEQVGIELTSDERLSFDAFMDHSSSKVNQSRTKNRQLAADIERAIDTLLDRDAHRAFADITGLPQVLG